MGSEWQELEALKGTQAPRRDRPDVLTSDVAGYAFCGRSWWLRRQERLEAGTAAHARVGAAIGQGALLLQLVWVCVAYAAAIGAACVWMLTQAAR